MSSVIDAELSVNIAPLYGLQHWLKTICLFLAQGRAPYVARQPPDRVVPIASATAGEGGSIPGS